MQSRRNGRGERLGRLRTVPRIHGRLLQKTGADAIVSPCLATGLAWRHAAGSLSRRLLVDHPTFMAKQPPASGSSKNKDDDSWGKLASDLLGIQLGGADDDFDLPDEEVPPAKPVVAATPSAPASVSDFKPTASQQQAEPDLSFPEDDLSFPEDDDDEVAADSEKDVEPVSIEETTAHSRHENEPDIWDQLESWNWEEPVKPAPRSHSEPPSGRGGDRSGRRGSSGPPRARDGGRERPRSRDEERPRPQREAASPAAEQAPRERPPRREEAPRREDRPRRSESRDEAPRAEQRPARQPESTEQRPPRSAPPRSVASVTPDDGFAAGLDDEPTPRRSPPASSRPAESRTAEPKVAPPARQPSPAGSSHDDDFAVDLFAELARAAGDSDTTEPACSDQGGSESSDEDRPRRRRRRRRGGRGNRPDGVVCATDADDRPDSEERNEDDPLAFASDDDSSTDDTEEDEASETRSEGTDDEGGEQPRPRRRRRRGRRRPDERPGEVAAVGVGKQSENEDDDDEGDDDNEPEARSERVEEEALAPVNYEGIPTWEEAISYLIRTRGPDPRGRGNGGSRGRGGPPQRR